ncbi:hypothetical protein CR513_33543, partial [Mucuna pruriens]
MSCKVHLPRLFTYSKWKFLKRILIPPETPNINSSIEPELIFSTDVLAKFERYLEDELDLPIAIRKDTI